MMQRAMRLLFPLLAGGYLASSTGHERSPLCTEVSVIAPCPDPQLRWEFDPHQGLCQSFSGCPGSGNNFNNAETCRAMCHTHDDVTTEAPLTTASTNEDVCLKPKLRGSCRAIYQRYYYNPIAEDCELFIYGGCHGNENNFQTRRACEATCRRRTAPTWSPSPSPSTSTPEPTTPSTPETTTANEVEQHSICRQPAVRGPCRGVILKWFYNVEHERCEIFPYGGCNGNRNRFGSLADCKQACGETKKLETVPEPREQHLVCPASAPYTHCQDDPCKGMECIGNPEAVCKPDFCGGCNAKFYGANGVPVNCASQVQPRSSKCDDFCKRATCPSCTICSENSGRCGCRPLPEHAECMRSSTSTTSTTNEPPSTTESLPSTSSFRFDACATALCPPCTSCTPEGTSYGCYQNLTLPGCLPEDPCERVTCGHCEQCIASERRCSINEDCNQYECRRIENCDVKEEVSSGELDLDSRCPAVRQSPCVRLRECNYHKDCKGGKICCPTACGTMCKEQ